MSLREQEKVQEMSYWKRLRVAAVSIITIVSCSSIAYAASVGNNNTGTVSQSESSATTGAVTNTNTVGSSNATTGASSSGVNNSMKIQRGASYSAPSLGRAEIGTDTLQLHSFLGGATLANTELDMRVKMKVTLIIEAHKEGLISTEAAKARIYLALEDMDDIQIQRNVPVLGLFGVSCNQRSLFNVLGLLCN